MYLLDASQQSGSHQASRDNLICGDHEVICVYTVVVRLLATCPSAGGRLSSLPVRLSRFERSAQLPTQFDLQHSTRLEGFTLQGVAKSKPSLCPSTTGTHPSSHQSHNLSSLWCGRLLFAVPFIVFMVLVSLLLCTKLLRINIVVAAVDMLSFFGSVIAVTTP